VTSFLKERDDLIFVFWENLCKPIGSFDKVSHVRSGHSATDELFRVLDVGVEAELFAGFFGYCYGVTGDHLGSGEYVSSRPSSGAAHSLEKVLL